MFPFIFQINMKNLHLSLFSKILLLLSAALFIGSIFVPMWRIELEAPQYPEGLVLQLHANKIAGDVDVINGLNHYIGMKTLHTEDFVEFKILPYIFGLFGVLAIVNVVLPKKKLLYAIFNSFIIFGILAASDFYRWNYNYGHDLDPNAAIKVPGMSYQPPLLGYKQLLNFGAYSIPDIGGWMLITAGLLLFIAIAKETNLLQKIQRRGNPKVLILVVCSFMFFSCGDDKAVPIKLNVDNCDYCKMGIADGKYGAEVITQKGRVYKFDDIACMTSYCKENHTTKFKGYYIHDHAQENILIPAETAFFITGGAIKTPMHGEVVGFSEEDKAKEFLIKYGAEKVEWKDVLEK